MGWAKAVGGVLLYDAWLARRGRATLTRDFQEAWRTRGGRAVIVMAVAFLSLHLAGALPDGWDPLTRIRVRIEG